MYCPKCGSRLPETAIFCNKCGSNLEEQYRSDTVKRICKSCGASMTMNEDHSGYYCEHCGSIEILAEYEKIELNRMKAQIAHDLEIKRNKAIQELELKRKQKVQELELQKSYSMEQQKIELERLRSETHQEQLNQRISKAKEERQKYAYIDGVFFRLGIAFLVFSVIGITTGFFTKNIISGIIAIVQLFLCSASITLGFRKILEGLYEWHVALVLLAIGLTPVWMTFMI